MDLLLTVQESEHISHNGLIAERQLTKLRWELTATETINGVKYTANPACGYIELEEPTESGYISYNLLKDADLQSWTQSNLENTPGPEGYDSLWAYAVSERQADIKYQASV